MATKNEILVGGESKDIYFIILYERRQKEKIDELIFSKSNIIPTNIYTNELIAEKGTYFYIKVFKFKNIIEDERANNPINFNIEFDIGNDNYKVLFDVKEYSFIYDVELKKRRKILKNIPEDIIDQNIKDYLSKLNIFIQALKKNNEEDKIDKLYKETIEIYSDKKSFSFLIKLFVHIYKNKEFCPLLMEKFKKMNCIIKENEKNMDRSKDLEQYVKDFNIIASEADDLIKNNSYDPIQFYGILLCYLNYYDYDNFMNIYNKLFRENIEVLYEILLIYESHFLNPIKQDLEFYIKFISYAALKEFSFFENGLNYIIDIETFIIVIEKTKEHIINKYHKKIFKPITLKAKLPLIKREKSKEIDNIIPAIESIINFSKKNKILLIYFHSIFWIKILKNYNELNDTNISICFRLREIFVKYNDLVNELFKNNKKSDIKNDINKYFERDEFSFLLDKNIKKYLEINKELSNADILGFIEAFNPYYKEDNYSYKRDSYIFNYLNLNDNNNQFIKTFRKFEFEKIFKDNIFEFLNKIVSKVQNISNLGTVLELIDIKKIPKVNDYLSLLKNKYEYIIKKDKKSLTVEELKETVKIITHFFDLIYNYEKNFNFIEKKINELDKMMVSLIYYELLKRCKGNEHKKMKEFIYQKLETDIIINLIDNLNEKEKMEFLGELLNRCKFTKEDFFSNNEDKKIELLYDLYEKGKLKINDEENYYGEIEPLLGEIIDDIESKIGIKKLETFLIDKKIVIKKLGLIKIILRYFNPEEYYKDLIKSIENIKSDINDLTYIKNLLQIFHREKYRKEMKEIVETIKEMQEKSINNYKTQKMQESIQKLKELKITADQVKKYKDFLFFNVLYDEAYGNDQEKRFNEALNNLDKIKGLIEQNVPARQIYQNNKSIFNKIKEMLSHNESKADEFMKQMKEYFEINDKKELMKELTIIFKSKKYEMDLKSIIYFFENFHKDDNKDDWIKKLSNKYKNLSEMDLEDLKMNLNELKDNGIYDYEENNNYCKIFTSLYEKKEALDFLLLKTNQDINNLYERIDPTNLSITMENIQDTEECIKVFKKLKEINDNLKIFNHIKNLNDQQIKKFEIYSKDYSSIIELDRNEDSSLNLCEQINNIIKNAKIIIKQDNEIFSYGENRTITMEKLIHLKNKIHIQAPKEIKGPKDQFQIKCDKLVCFKNVVSNLEIIYDYMNILRTKGSNLPILIKIIIKYPEIKYFINQKCTDFDNIRDFLFKAKTDYISQLESVYKQKQYSRFLFGKSFRNIMRHLDSRYYILDILRFILNKTDNKQEIKDGIASNTLRAEDYVHQYKIYNENSFDNILNYLTSLFENNGTSLQKHYEAMLIKDKEKNKYKGIYLHICENETTEEFILNIFMKKLGQLPIAQNVLICSKETSQEEMQAFFYRAILCDYNTLFVVEIKKSFSDYQQNIMYTYIDKLLTYKNEKYKEYENKKNVDKKKTKEYFKSCVIFVYDQNNKDNISFLKEIGNLDTQEFLMNKSDILKAALSNSNNESYLNYSETLKNKEQDKYNISNNSLNLSFEKDIFQNIKVITSDICGLGKSYKITKMIEKDNKQYFHFILGGILSKTIIFQKLSILLKKIKKENKKNYQNVAIHLDLTESKETSIINEFLFSFLITKFYTNNENIIYIPKDIDIYIEIPNSFENFLWKLGIFNCKRFIIENIEIDNILKLDLPKKIIDIFNRLLEFDSNNKIEKFIKKYIGINKFSYHQIQIFIKLFISLFNKFESKLIVYSGEKVVTEKFFEVFAEFTKYFTLGGFAKLLMYNKDDLENDNENKNYIDLISEIYDNDLKEIKFNIPRIIKNNNKLLFDQLIIEEKTSTEYQSSKYYLQRIKEILDLPNDVEKEEGDNKSLLSILNYEIDNYVITNDNYKKMILLAYRIKANIPVIIMGETGCGKTALILKLNQILNNGEISVKIINMHPWINDEDICKEMKEINEEAKKNKNKEIWILFDEINTCLSLFLLNEILINRTYNGEKISENIRLIGACNPYRKIKPDREKYGLIQDYDNENELIYLVQPFPQTLFYYIFSFGIINEKDEKNYIYSIIEKLFTKDEKNLHEITKDAIFECHKFLREYFDPSVVSLRELSRFLKCVEFFQKYYTIKNEYENEINESNKIINENLINKENKEKIYKIKSIICSIYLCYYIRLIDDMRTIFNFRLRSIFLKLVNMGETDNKKNDEKKGIDIRGNLIDEINYEELKYDLKDQNINQFSDFLRIEEDFILDKIEMNKDIGKNHLLKEIIFLSFFSALTKIPLIIVGKPGTGKSLSTQLIYKSMRGKYSKDKFFQKFPQIIQTYFQGSESTKPEEVEKLFEIAEKKLQFYIHKNMKKEEIPTSMILLDELGLAQKSESYPLKILHSKLEYKGKYEGVSFIGISNYSLDASKENRCLNLLVPNLEDRIDQLIDTSKSIVKSISENLSNNIIFDILARTYYEYKKNLLFIKELTALKQFDSKNKESKEPIDLKNKQFVEIKNLKQFKKLFNKDKKIKIDFHGNRDLYSYIKGIAREIRSLNNSDDNEIVSIIEKQIERNFGGIDYEIDIDIALDVKITDIESKIKLISEIFKEFNLKKKKPINKKKNKTNEKNKKNEKDENIIVSSVFLFKKLYNLSCRRENSYKIRNNNIIKYDLNRCINDNINDVNNRYLLLEIKPSLSSLIYQNIRIQFPYKLSEFYEGSPFIDDNNNEYRYKKVNEIQEDAKKDKIIILQNLNQIHPFLYDLYNMNNIIKDEQKYSKICLDNYNGQLMMVNDFFRIVILVDRDFINEVDIEFLNRLEKMIIIFDKLLDNEQIILAKQIIEEINFNYHLKENQKLINYVLNDLLINCGKEEIEGLIYYLSIEIKKNKNKIDENIIKERIYYKIIKMLPQDIITILPDIHIIKKYYYEEKKYYNLKEYINDAENKKYKISIIYTFNNIANIFYGVNNEMRFMVSEIKTENQLKTIIDEIKNKNENINNFEKNYNILIQFEQLNSNKIQFISNFITKYLREDNYNYIFLIHIKRNFNFKNNDTIYSIPDINPDINQLFIDNLNGINIKLKDLFDKNIEDILNNEGELMDLDREFKKTLKNFVYKGLIEKKNFLSSFIKENSLINEDNYIDEIQKFMDEEIEFKQKIIEKAKELIKNERQAEGNCKSLLEIIFKTNYIDKNSIDIISILLDYIKEEIFSKYLKYIFEVLEDNNILTTLLEIKNNKDNLLDENIIEQLKNNYLNAIVMEKGNYEPKFLFKYKIPGFFNFYKKLSNFINKNITVDYFNNEKYLREYSGKKSENQILEFHEKELDLLYLVYEEINKDNFIFEFLNQIPPDLILKDYTTYYLDKYNNYNSENYQNDINNKLIELLLKLRFNEDQNQIIKNNQKDPIKILLIKIMWIESNINYILSILKVFSYANEIFNDENNLYNMIEELIYDKSKSIRYITNENKNPEYTKEVNECYYIILASLCLTITSEKIKLTESFNEENKVEINLYCKVLKETNIILQNLNNDLKIYLNEMYIIDELKEVIELQYNRKINIEKIEEIRNYLRENALIIQKNQPDKINELKENFINIYNSIISKEINIIKDKNYCNKYYDTLRYIFYKEIYKISDSSYQFKILEKLIQEKEIIKKSNDIFQILLKDYVKKEEFKSNPNKISKGDDDIIRLIEDNLIDNQEDNYFALSETLLYFFEKNTIIYLENILNNGKLLENEPLDIFKECLRFLKISIESPKKLEKEKKKKYITKLFSLGYIKTFCFSFIKMFDDIDSKMIKPEKIIDAINEFDLKNMIKLYNYKILFNQNKLDALLNPKSKKKYKLEQYENFNNFIKFSEKIEIDYKFQTLDNENYENIYEIIERYKKESFKKKIKKEEIDYENLNIDNFYIASINLILYNLKRKDFEQSHIYFDYYKNICEPIFEKNDKRKLSAVIQFFFNPAKYKEIKKDYGINSDNIECLLFGYRFCLNELSEENTNGIYSTLYDGDNINYLLEKCYPGSDSKDAPYYDLYFKISQHLIEKPNEGCYVCLCNKGYYHSVPLDFQLEKEIKCPYCSKDLWTKRDDYFRIFKDNEELESMKQKTKLEKLDEINYMTLNEFKEKFIRKLFNNEKGLPTIDKNYFKKDNKNIRNLSQISYRLLNYILYSHLFFARILTKKNKFDKYIPKGMNWGETLNECWILLKNELLKKGIDSIDIFINYTFKDLFYKLHSKEYIDNYGELIECEKDLEQIIQKKVECVQKECEKYKKLIEEDNEDKNSSINLLKEKYESQIYLKKDFPFYENFYYSEYLDEKNLSEKLSHMNENKYPILRKYLEYQNNYKNENDDYSLDNLYLFNTALNLFSEKYSNQITREYAEKKLLKDDEIYQNEGNKKYKNKGNQKLIDDFIKYYNKLKIKDSNGNTIELTNKNHLCDFFIDNNNEIGKTYKDIYKIFLKKQNEEIENILRLKNISGALENNCIDKIYVQQIKEEEIFNINVSEIFPFIVFNSSYRAIIDNNNYEKYNQYEINFDSIEETMTDLLLKNKKLLYEDIIEFSYKNEIFSNEVNDLITSFKDNYNIVEIFTDDKKVLDQFFKDKEINKNKCKHLINDFITLLEYLNDLRKFNKDTDITEDSHISEVLELLKDNISKDFFLIFKDKNNQLIIKKIIDIFKYFLQLIYKYVKEEIKYYQEDLKDEMEDLDDDLKNELEDKKKKLDEYYNKNALISKKDFAFAIQLFMTLVLFREKYKKKKIKFNSHNIINYLKKPDFWDKNIYNNEKFKKNLYELRIINIQINQIIWLYNYLIDYKEDNKDIDIESKKKDNDDKKNLEKNENNNEPDKGIIECIITSEENNNDVGNDE